MIYLEFDYWAIDSIDGDDRLILYIDNTKIVDLDAADYHIRLGNNICDSNWPETMVRVIAKISH